MIKSFVISMKNANERRDHIHHQFTKHGINFEFFDALNSEQGLAQAKRWQISISKTALAPSEIGCMMSHVSLWKHAIDHTLPYIAIFEDDVFLSEDIPLFFSDTSWLPKEFDVIKTETMYNQILINSEQLDIYNNRALHRLHSDHWGGAGYILSLAGATKLFHLITQQPETTLAIDHMIFDTFRALKTSVVYQVVPALCIQDHLLHPTDQQFKSHLEPERIEKTRTNKVTLSPLSKIKREALRIKHQMAPNNLLKLYKLCTFKFKKVVVPFQ